MLERRDRDEVLSLAGDMVLLNRLVILWQLLAHTQEKEKGKGKGFIFDATSKCPQFTALFLVFSGARVGLERD